MARFFWGLVAVCFAALPALAQPPKLLPEVEPAPNAPAAPDGNCGPDGAVERVRALCGPPGRVWAEGELLLWFPRGYALPPLVTTSPAGTPRAAAGVLGQPGTTVVYGNQTVNDDLAPGFRLRTGAWIDCQHLWGIEGSFFFLGSNSQGFQGNSSQYPVLARPFFNTQTGAQDSQLVSLPGAVAGALSVDARSGTFYGFDLNSRCNLCCACDYRIDFLAGYRFLRLTDDLTVQESLTATNPANVAPVGTTITLRDHFRTENTFNGGQVGLAGEYRVKRFFVGARGLAALGNIHRTAAIDGATEVTVPGQNPVSNPTGLLALPSNSGRFSSDRLGFASEVGLNLGYQVAPHVRATIGYSFLCLTDVLRPGDQIDATVNAAQLFPALPQTGPLRPAFTPRSSTFWAQGINFGLAASY